MLTYNDLTPVIIKDCSFCTICQHTPPALPPALTDKVLKVFGQPGEKYVYIDVCIHTCTLYMFVFEGYMHSFLCGRAFMHSA